jgi:penicillin-insensitive murein endopeptidase
MSNFDKFIEYLTLNYNCTIEDGIYGIFSRKNNDRCRIEFTIEHETDEDTKKPYRRLKIDIFQCLPPIGTASAEVPRSSGLGREMMLHFLMFINVKYPDIRIVFLEAEAYADKKNMTEEQYYEYEENIDKHQEKLEGYYNSLGLKLEDGWFEGYLNHIISSIKNYDNMKSFNSAIKHKDERRILKDFGINITRKKRNNNSDTKNYESIWMPLPKKESPKKKSPKRESPKRESPKRESPKRDNEHPNKRGKHKGGKHKDGKHKDGKTAKKRKSIQNRDRGKQ